MAKRSKAPVENASGPGTGTDQPTGLALMRAPFPAHQISKLPKETRKQIDARNKNNEGVVCDQCGSWHHPKAAHLDYVGHAALTDRLLDADPNWNWEPVANPAMLGLPVEVGGMWIRLTVCGVTRLGFGAADGKSGGDAIKEVIGDALRNAAMRFGAALDLWHKGHLRADDVPPKAPKPAPKALAPKAGSHPHENDTITMGAPGKPGQVERLWRLIRQSKRSETEVRMFLTAQYGIDSTAQIKRKDYDAICAAIQAPGPLRPLDSEDTREPGAEG